MAVKKKYDRNVLGRGLDNIGTGKGRGLDALIDTGDVHAQGSSNLNEIALSMISPNPNQPRTDFDEAALQELAASIVRLVSSRPSPSDRWVRMTIRSSPVSAVGEQRNWQVSLPSLPISVQRKTRK